MSDLQFQQLSTVQSDKEPTPAIVTAAATISPTTFLTFIEGSTPVQTINPPVSGCHMICLIAGGAALTTTGGNVVGGTTTVDESAYLFVYDPSTAKYTIVGSTTS